MAHLQRFDAVILDMEMPEMSGYAIAQEMRTLPRGEASEEAGRAGLQPARKGFSV